MVSNTRRYAVGLGLGWNAEQGYLRDAPQNPLSRPHGGEAGAAVTVDDPTSLRGVKALLFDVFGTVVDWRSGVAREAGVLLARYGGTAAAAGDFADAWRRRYSPAMEEVRSGRRPFTRLDVLHRENLVAAIAEFGIDAARVPVAELDELNRAWHRLDPWPDAIAGLERLRSRYVIAPLSNGNIALLLDMRNEPAFRGTPFWAPR
jgi:2-haloalkanoic acid dehalogenase type II